LRREIDKYEAALFASAPAARRPPKKEPPKPGVMSAINTLFDRTFDWMDKAAPVIKAQREKSRSP
jgi:hypothetical protein